MATITTPYMGLVIPVPTAENGPAWAVEINNAIGANPLMSGIDGHDHSTGKGVQITPSGINITSDFSMNLKNLISARSVRYDSNIAPITAASPDLLCTYVSGVDLYYNDGSTQIRITQSGSVAGATGTITGLPSGTASAAYQSSPGTFQFLQATSTAANIDVGSVIIRYPGSYPTPMGNFIMLEAPTSLASGYSLILPALPAQTNVMTLSAAGVISSITYNAVGQAMTSVGANAILSSVNSGTVVNDLLAITTNANLPGSNVTADDLNIVTSNVNSSTGLAITAAVIDGSGTLVSGEGFTSITRTGAGQYTLVYQNEYLNSPTVCVTVADNFFTWFVPSQSSTGCNINLYNYFNGMLADDQFNVIIIGHKT